MPKTNGGDIICKPLVPSPGRLLQSVKGFPQATHMIRMKGVLETQGLMHIDCNALISQGITLVTVAEIISENAELLFFSKIDKGYTST